MPITNLYTFFPCTIVHWNALPFYIDFTYCGTIQQWCLPSGTCLTVNIRCALIIFYEALPVGAPVPLFPRNKLICSPVSQNQTRSVRVAERLALPTSDHGVAGSNPAGGEILPEPKRHFIAQSLSCSPFHRLEMTEILLKGRKTLTHPSSHQNQTFLISYVSCLFPRIAFVPSSLHFWPFVPLK